MNMGMCSALPHITSLLALGWAEPGSKQHSEVATRSLTVPSA